MDTQEMKGSSFEFHQIAQHDPWTDAAAKFSSWKKVLIIDKLPTISHMPKILLLASSRQKCIQ